MSTADRLLEKLIIRRLLRECRAAGFVPVQVWDGGEYVPATTRRAVIETIYAVNSNCTIHFAPIDDRTTWGRLGVLIVTGNGCDCISDWHCGNSVFSAALDRVAEYIDQLEDA